MTPHTISTACGGFSCDNGVPQVSQTEDDLLTKSSETREDIMGLHLSRVGEFAASNMSASARITQALKVNDISTAQRIAASAAMMSGQFQIQAVNQSPAKVSERQVGVWA
jgi:hypothetical protein